MTNEIKVSQSPLIFVMVVIFALLLSVNYCGSLAVASVDKLKIEGAMTANDVDLRLPSGMKVVRNIDENRGEK